MQTFGLKFDTLPLAPETRTMSGMATKPQRTRSGRLGETVQINLFMPVADVAHLDAWSAKQPKPMSRPEAIRAFVAAKLKMMGET